jgi:hypothetical protein
LAGNEIIAVGIYMSFDIPNLVLSFAVGTVGAGLTGAIIKKRFDSQMDIWRSQRGWKERSVTELLGPIYMQLDRTRLAFERWDKKNPYLEGKVICEGNTAIRDLLLTKVNLVPPELRKEASRLVQHYDVWLEEFVRWRVNQGVGEGGPDFIFVGPKGYQFPKEADEGFTRTFERYWNELYGAEQSHQKSATGVGGRG